MKAVIQDTHGRRIETIDGHYKEGKFLYRRAPFPTFITYHFSHEESIPCDLAKIMDLDKKHDFAVYRYDGKDYIQLDLKESQPTDITDYTTFYKLGEYAVDSILKKPLDMKTILEFLILGLILLSAFINFYVAQNSYNMAKNTTKPMYLIAEQNNQLLTLNRNDTLIFYNLTRAFYSYMRSHNP